MPECRIQPATMDHVPAVVEVHEMAFHHSFTTRLGTRFLVRYYTTAMGCPGGRIYIAREDGGVVGFVCGFDRPHEFYARLKRQLGPIATDVLSRVLRHPYLAVGLVRDYRFCTARASAPEAGVTELSSLAVHPTSTQHGTGRALLQHFIDGAFASGAATITLTTDADNKRVNTLYQRAGFRIGRSFMIGSRRMNQYSLSRNDVGAPC